MRPRLRTLDEWSRGFETVNRSASFSAPLAHMRDVYIEALHDLIKARPTNDREFRLNFMALWDEGGAPVEDVVLRVLDDAHRFAG
jgi:hypothetical protein